MDHVLLLKASALKVTPQRLSIVQSLEDAGHMSIDGLYEKLQEKFPSISLATIYKNIHAMVESAFLSEVKIPHAKSVYELAKREHAHLICSECEQIQDIFLDTQSLIDEAKKKSAFSIETTSVVFKGVCPHCANSSL